MNVDSVDILLSKEIKEFSDVMFSEFVKLQITAAKCESFLQFLCVGRVKG